MMHYLQELDGSVFYVEADTAGEMFPVMFLRRWLPPDYFDEIEYIYLFRSKVTDAGLAQLQGLTSLQRIYLNNTQVTDPGLAHLQGLTNLRRLDLEYTQVTDAGLAHLQGLTSLQVLHLENTQVTEVRLAELRKALPKCQIYGP